jgi:nucleoid DNA-binding protein
LGFFSTKEKTARIDRNPKSGVQVQFLAKKVVKFKPGKELIEVLRDSMPKQGV